MKELNLNEFGEERVEALAKTVEAYSLKQKDLEDEIIANNIEILKLTENFDAFKEKDVLRKSLERELNCVTEDPEPRILELEAQLNALKENEASKSKNRKKYLERLVNLSIQRQRVYHELTNSVNKLSFPNCWYGVDCNRRICRFYHRYVYKKDSRMSQNVKQEIEENIPSAYL